MENINTRQIMVRRPFRRILPNGYKCASGIISGNMTGNEPYDNPTYQIITQMDFLREFEPSGHAINDPLVYPDRLRQDPDTKQWFREAVIRCSFAFQRIITVKHLVHLCGNDIQFEMEGDTENEKVKDTFFKFRTGWAVKDMEIAWYEAAKSVKITGDTAFVGYLRKGKFYWKVLSFEKVTCYILILTISQGNCPCLPVRIRIMTITGIQLLNGWKYGTANTCVVSKRERRIQ